MLIWCWIDENINKSTQIVSNYISADLGLNKKNLILFIQVRLNKTIL